MVGREVVRILGRPAFHDLQLVASGDLSYLGPQWRRDIAFAGSDVSMQGDIAAGTMIMGVEGIDPARRERCAGLRPGVGCSAASRSCIVSWRAVCLSVSLLS